MPNLKVSVLMPARSGEKSRAERRDAFGMRKNYPVVVGAHRLTVAHAGHGMAGTSTD